ncbi:MAG: Y-family DNA polymerase [Halopseudomonas sp.]
MLALVDCNSFYASCEQVFRPDLRGKPVVVVSNNDGCIVAANRQAKALNYPPFSPYFKVAGLLRHHGVTVFSSNYELYGDLSARVMETLREFSPDMEVYSIDEAFLSLDGIQGDLVEYGRTIRRRVWRDVRIPVSVGIAPTKTLAKIANHVAKRDPQYHGSFSIESEAQRRHALKQFAVGEVWGIGKRLSQRLQALGVTTAWDLARQPPKLLRLQFSINMERTLRELNGEPCIEFDEQPQPKQQIFSTRSFGERVYELESLQQAVSSYASRAMMKLRAQDALVATVLVFIQTSRFDAINYSRSEVIKLPQPTNDTRLVVQQLRRVVGSLFKEGLPYAKAGVGLIELISSQHQQQDLFSPQQSARSQALMAVIDQVNAQQPHGVFLASDGIDQQWRMTRQRCSPAYTTRWDALPTVR